MTLDRVPVGLDTRQPGVPGPDRGRAIQQARLFLCLCERGKHFTIRIRGGDEALLAMEQGRVSLRVSTGVDVEGYQRFP